MSTIENATNQTVEFLTALFPLGAPILIRPIEIYSDGKGGRTQKVDHKGIQYLRRGMRINGDRSGKFVDTPPGRLASILAHIDERATKLRCNQFFGVLPRYNNHYYNQSWQIRAAQVLWADIDHVSIDDATLRINGSGLPRPSILVHSGGGAHVYWLLNELFHFDDAGGAPPAVYEKWHEGTNGKKGYNRKFIKGTEGEPLWLDLPCNKQSLSPKAQLVQDVVKGIAESIGGDSTHDLARLLRLPGTMNRKNERDGQEPVPCTLIHCEPNLRYAFDDFKAFADRSPEKQQREKINKVQLPTPRKLTPVKRDGLNDKILACDLAEKHSRSEVDYALCIWAIEKSIAREEVWSLVQHVGKFATDGERYFQLTWSKAESAYRTKAVCKVESKTNGRHHRGSKSLAKINGANILDASAHDHESDLACLALATDTAPTANADVDNDSSEGGLPEVILPGDDSVTITIAAERLGQLMSGTERFYSRGGASFRLANEQDDGQLVQMLQPLRADAACSDFESVARIKKLKRSEESEIEVDTYCPESIAKLIINSQTFKRCLPKVKVISPVPVLIERDGELIQVSGYDRQSGIMAHGQRAVDVPLADAMTMILDLFEEYRFATAGDRARAFASLITPALVFGGLLGGRAPVDLSEADQSQAGKGYRGKLVAAIYGSVQTSVTPHKSGVGSVKEAFDHALVKGANFVSFDNFRGKLNEPSVESFLTEDRYLARVPYSGQIEIDPTRVVVSFTSNSAEATIDFANRSSIVRILKQPPGYQFRQYPEGSLLDHVRANQSKYLGAVFAIVREWHRAGKRAKQIGEHDFRRWASVLGIICEETLGVGQLLDGHRDAQRRVASPGLSWLRSVAQALFQAGYEGQWLRVNQMLRALFDAGVQVPGFESVPDLSNSDQFNKVTRSIGSKLKQFMIDDTITIDDVTITREIRQDASWREVTEYCITHCPQSSDSATPNLH